MRNMKIITCLLTITSLVFTACGGGSNDIEKAKSVATTEHLKRYTEAISHDSCQGRKPFSEGADRAVNYIAHQMKEIGLNPSTAILISNRLISYPHAHDVRIRWS